MLNTPDKEGITTREHLSQVEASTGKRPAELDGPELPDLAEHVWEWFIELHNARTGMEPISYGEIMDWCRLTGIKPAYWEVKAIKRIDGIFMQQSAQNLRKSNG